MACACASPARRARRRPKKSNRCRRRTTRPSAPSETPRPRRARRPGAPDAVALQGLLRRLGRVAVQVLEAEPEEKTPPRRAAAVATETVALDAADLAAVRRANARAAAAATTLGCREVSYPADLVAFLRDRSAYECRSAAAASAGKDRRNAQRAVVRALTRHARRPPSPSPERPRRTRPAKSVAGPARRARARRRTTPVDADAAASASTPAADEPVSPLNAMERDILTVLDDRGGEIFISHLGTGYRQIHGKPLDYRALGFSDTQAARRTPPRRLPATCQLGATLGPSVAARCVTTRKRCAAAPAPAVSSNADEKPTAPDTVASPPPPARPHRPCRRRCSWARSRRTSAPRCGPSVRRRRGYFSADDAPIDESADSAVSGRRRFSGDWRHLRGHLLGQSHVRRFVELDRGGVGLLHPSKCRLAAAGAPILPAKRDRLFVRVLRIRDDGKLDFSTLGLDPKTGAPTPDAGATTTTAPREAPAAARNAKPAAPSLRAVERRSPGGHRRLRRRDFIAKLYQKLQTGPPQAPRLPGTGLRAARAARRTPPRRLPPTRGLGRDPAARERGTADGVRGQAATAGAGGGATQAWLGAAGTPAVTPDASPDAARKPRPSPPTIDSDYERRPAAARALPPPAPRRCRTSFRSRSSTELLTCGALTAEEFAALKRKVIAA